VLAILATQLKEIKQNGPDDNHPNPYVKVPIDSDLVKFMVCKVLSEYLV
jgi:hypothetical protein